MKTFSMKELEEEDITKALKLRKKFSILEDERSSKAFLNLENTKQGYNKAILLNKSNPEYNPNLEESAANPKLIPVTDRGGILPRNPPSLHINLQETKH